MFFKHCLAVSLTILAYVLEPMTLWMLAVAPNPLPTSNWYPDALSSFFSNSTLVFPLMNSLSTLLSNMGRPFTMHTFSTEPLARNKL
ncbi:hypothetical protein ColLi_09081 [Colletotrichum liriopes]|uniref:Uncharacterized protein n=1 Tax=Colletotrichum liriopes TaxID=708192 RepID=A0AA37GUA4_9PEZI|nr:hypothetical protein ColLi_09081 [Colletotrichum liriopes]